MIILGIGTAGVKATVSSFIAQYAETAPQVITTKIPAPTMTSTWPLLKAAAESTGVP